MSIVTKDYCACGKLFSEENTDCVFNYHKIKESTISKHNRACPKCGSTCVVCSFDDSTKGYDKDGFSWDGLGVCCSQCDWELETRSANS